MVEVQIFNYRVSLLVRKSAWTAFATAFTLIFMFISTRSAAQEGPIARFQGAINAYDTANYTAAAEAFDQLYNEGYTGLELCYNAGTAYLQAGQLGRAMLYFERAMKFNPSDRELVLNTEFAEMLTVDVIEELPRPLLVTWYEQIATQKSWSAWLTWAAVLAWLAWIAYFLVGTSWVSDRFQSAVKAVWLFGTVGSLLMGGMGLQQRRVQQKRVPAVIMEESVYAKNEPNSASSDLFILHEGTVVQAGRRIGDWLKIELADGKVGWIPIAAVEAV